MKTFRKKTATLVALTMLAFPVFAKTEKEPNLVQVHQLTGHAVNKMLQTAFDAAVAADRFITVTIVDRSGKTLGVLRHEKANLATLEATYKKAYTAVAFKMPTDELTNNVLNNGWTPELRYLNDSMIFLAGGLPIVVEGDVVGAIGVGGGSDADDISFAKAALATLEKK